MDTTKFIILSGAYCGEEIVAEFGQLPPSFLPIGSKRLFEYQFAQFTEYGTVVLSLPLDFVVSENDKNKIENHNVRIVRVPSSLSLAQSLQLVLEIIDAKGPIRLLHGDTLIKGIQYDLDNVIAIDVSNGYYNWAYCESDDDTSFHLKSGLGDGTNERKLACGYFSFSNAVILREALCRTNDFIGAVNLYSKNQLMDVIYVDEWLDFGHLPLFYHSKRNLFTARSFNNLHSDGLEIVKMSPQIDKMRAEAFWYQNLPERLRLYTPRFIGPKAKSEIEGYRLEYLYLPTLAELSVFGRLPQHVWISIISRCFDFLECCKEHRPPDYSYESSEQFSNEFFNQMFIQKTWKRFEKFINARNIDLSEKWVLNDEPLPPLKDWMNEVISAIKPSIPENICFWHGDFFYGNIFHDFRSNRIFCVDPRGMLENRLSLYGDIRYDAAKLTHSVIGLYDHIIASRCHLKNKSEREWQFSISPEFYYFDDLCRSFNLMLRERLGLSAKEVIGITILLFISMLPLHSDDCNRQDQLFVNAMRLYFMFVETDE